LRTDPSTWSTTCALAAEVRKIFGAPAAFCDLDLCDFLHFRLEQAVRAAMVDLLGRAVAMRCVAGRIQVRHHY
jgi:hypothetical protein